MSSDVGYTPGTQDISSPRFAAFYNWMMGRPLVRRMFDPLRRETVGQARSLGSSRSHHAHLCPGRVPPIPRCAVRECRGHPRFLFRAGSGAWSARDLAGAQVRGYPVAPRTCARARKRHRLGAGCVRATLDPLHGQLPLEPRYLAHHSANRFPDHAGGDESLQGIKPFCLERAATL